MDGLYSSMPRRRVGEDLAKDRNEGSMRDSTRNCFDRTCIDAGLSQKRKEHLDSKATGRSPLGMAMHARPLDASQKSSMLNILPISIY